MEYNGYMANKTKIFGEIEQKVIELYDQGANSRYIGLQINVAKGTIDSWLKKTGRTPNLRSNIDTIKKKKHFLDILSNCKNMKEAQRKSGLRYEIAIELAKEVGYKTRNRKDAALDKILTREEVEARIPIGHVYLDFIDRKYRIQCTSCQEKHIYIKTVSKLHQGCPKGKSGTIVSIEECHRRLQEVGYTLLEESFSGWKKPMIVFCSKGHKREMLRGSLVFTKGCPSCNNTGESKEERDLKEWVREMFPSVTKYKIPKDEVKTGRRKEIDIFIPELNLGIEYCGLYWHNETALYRANYQHQDKKRNGVIDKEELKKRMVIMRNIHKNKMDEARKNNIRLITIFSDEWLNCSYQVKNFLRSIMGINKTKIGARECEIREINKNLSNIFVKSNHIRGISKSTLVTFGLFYKDQLVAIMSGGVSHRDGNINSEDLYLDRLCFAYDISISGGSDKLFAALKGWAEKSGYKRILSWSDNRWSEGGVYNRLGFILEKELGIDYSYVHGNKRMSKQSCKKEHLLKRGATGDTESEMAKSLGYERIWDCGKKRWVYNLK